MAKPLTPFFKNDLAGAKSRSQPRGPLVPRSDKKHTQSSGVARRPRSKFFNKRLSLSPALRARAIEALGADFMRTAGYKLTTDRILDLIKTAEAKKKKTAARLRIWQRAIRLRPLHGAASGHEIPYMRRRKKSLAPDVLRTDTRLVLKPYARSRAQAGLRAYFKLFSLHGVSARRLVAVYRKVRFNLVKICAGADFDDGVAFSAHRALLLKARAAAAPRRTRRRRARVAVARRRARAVRRLDRYSFKQARPRAPFSSRAAPAKFVWGALGAAAFLENKQFFFNVFLARRVLLTFAAAFFYFSKRMIRRRGGLQAHLRSAVIRSALSVIVPAALGAASIERRDSPALSPEHSLWLEAVSANVLAGAPHLRVLAPLGGRAGLGSFLFSKEMFWWRGRPDHSPADRAFLWWYYRLGRRAGALMFLRSARVLSRARLVALEPAKKRALFAGKRDARQAAAAVASSSERKPLWSVNLLKVVPRAVALPTWDPVLRSEVNRRAVVWLDPLADNPARLLDRVPARFGDLKDSGRIFFRTFFRLFRARLEAEFQSPRSRLSLPAALMREEQFLNVMRTFVDSSAREYRDFTRDFSLSLRALGTWRHHGRGRAPRDRGISGLASARGNPRNVAGVARWFLERTPGYIFDKSLSVLYDRRAKKLMAGKDVVPGRFLISADLDPANFSSFYSCNRVAFVKLIADATRASARNGVFRGRPSLVASLRGAASSAFSLTAGPRHLLRGRRALRSRYRRSAGSARLQLRELGPVSLLGDRRWALAARARGRAGAASLFSLSARLSAELFSRTLLIRGGGGRRLLNNLFSHVLNFMQSGASAPYGPARAAALCDSFLDEIGRPRAAPRRGLFLKLLGSRRAFRSKSVLWVRTFIKYILASQAYPFKFPTLTRYRGVWFRSARRPRASVRSLLFARAFYAQSFFMRRRFRRNYHFYMYKHVYVRRACLALRDSLRSALPAYRAAGVRNLLGLLGDEYHQPLFKHNPDAAGRSRVFYYVQKKSRIMRKSNKPYRIMRLYLPFMNLSSARLATHLPNKHMVDQHARRVDGSRRHFKLKIFIRHLLRRDNNYTPFGLFSRWRAVKRTKRKWLTYYRKLEGGLAKYVWVVGLVHGRRAAKQFVEAGLFYVNGVVCTNPDYVVSPGDVVTMNAEAYRFSLTRRAARFTKSRLAAPNAQNTLKRRALLTALEYTRRITAAAGAGASVRGHDERYRASAALKLLGERGWRRPGAAPARSQIAPGGASVTKADVYGGGISRFSAEPTWRPEDKRRLVRAFSAAVKKWDASASFNGLFFYRRHNSVYAVRHPSSVKEFFSACRARQTDAFNPRVTKIFISHRHWH